MRVRPWQQHLRTCPHTKTRLAQVPDEWSSRVTWLQYWRALTQYLLSPGPRLAAGLARTLQARRPQSAAASSAPPHPAMLSQHFRKCVAALHAARPPLTRPPPAPLQSASLLRSPAEDAGRAPPPPPLEALLLRRPPAAHPAASPGPSSSSSSSPADGKARPPFAASFGEGVAAWTRSVRRPLVGMHVRLGDGCGDAKRGGCKYVKSFAHAVTRLREAGVTSGATLPSGGPTLLREPKGRRRSFL